LSRKVRSSLDEFLGVSCRPAVGAGSVAVAVIEPERAVGLRTRRHSSNTSTRFGDVLAERRLHAELPDDAVIAAGPNRVAR
jgi:hypothetical protein